MFGNDRLQMRRMFTDSWQKLKQGTPLEPLEQMITEIIKQHPEYHKMLEDPAGSLDRDFMPEEGQTNPFLHMAMHISIQEQISTDRPNGVRLAYQKLTLKTVDPHEVEHQMMECLGRMLWEAQRSGGMPDEQLYLDCIRKL
ncbi:DUF1841 family protein [Solemya velesiana gill symbiont]|uniref:DUF1841 domain-containing protein n=1 Tax=Solemya velesiana gill symbiont TaxID=1918948 RepID=A0A1T2KUU5_9GAMM|nr:DUF1841 family protein [Solemya velesiana gill symbiont]OOZ36633.1 hypothetical protein BOW51_06235 [Solemya velesiana gill symbiont]